MSRVILIYTEKNKSDCLLSLGPTYGLEENKASLAEIVLPNELEVTLDRLSGTLFLMVSGSCI